MKPCEYCGNPTKEYKYQEVRFCSVSCANKSRIKIKEKPCEYCGVNFKPPSNHAKQKFCSIKCRNDAKRTSKLVKCSNCGKKIRRQLNRIEKLSNSFCSKKCEIGWRKIHASRGADHPQYKERILYQCDYCGEYIYRLKSQVRKYVFCDKECRLQWQRESGYTKGINSPTWLGGHSDHRGANWKHQSRVARKRDNFACQRCGITEKTIKKSLDVHHIKPWREFDNDYISANHIDNLITLCNSCHQIMEWESGSRSNLYVEEKA